MGARRVGRRKDFMDHGLDGAGLEPGQTVCFSAAAMAALNPRAGARVDP